MGFFSILRAILSGEVKEIKVDLEVDTDDKKKEISDENLRNKDFDKAIYNWDCY